MTPLERPECPPELQAELERARELTSRLDEEIDEMGVRNVMPLKTRSHLRRVLSDVFDHTCCYCESKLGGAADGELDRFRPQTGRASNDGTYAFGAYAHLAYEWRNMYLACPICNRLKANRFPLDGEPAPPKTPYDELVRMESPMLLDPCHDDPDEHLLFQKDGMVVGRTDRGLVTIEVFGLNREALVRARRAQADSFALSEKTGHQSGYRTHEAVWRQLARAAESPAEAREAENAAREKQDYFETARGKVSTETGEGLENYRARACYIDRIYIENVGPISRLELNPSESQASRAPAFALLGVNGVGKSTVLRSIALAMAGEKYAKELGVSSKSLLSKNAQSGHVRIKTSDGRDDIVMSLRRGRRVSFNLDSSRAIVLAYGATRLLPQGRHKAKAGKRHAKIDNLFNPFLPVTDVKSWLGDLDASKLTEVNHVLASLLPDGSKLELVWDAADGQILVSHGGGPAHDIQELSDGYKSMVAVAADILSVMSVAGYHSMESAQGIVLIDEMGNHLHPSWRMSTVSALRRAFPSIQFIFSTHDPLCLRGLEQGEVAVLRRNRSGQVYALEDLPAVDRLRVDQLLTSEHFGLQSTMDPQEQELIEQYEELAQRESLSDEERADLERLAAELTEGDRLGSTRRERMLLKLLDFENMDDAVSNVGTVKAQQLADDTVTKLKEVLRAVMPRRDA